MEDDDEYLENEDDDVLGCEVMFDKKHLRRIIQEIYTNYDR